MMYAMHELMANTQKMRNESQGYCTKAENKEQIDKNCPKMRQKMRRQKAQPDGGQVHSADVRDEHPTVSAEENPTVDT